MRTTVIPDIKEDEVTVTVEKKPKTTTGKKKMGRPKKPKEDLRSKQIPSYYTEKEYAALEEYIASLTPKVTVGEFVRSATLEKLN